MDKKRSLVAGLAINILISILEVIGLVMNVRDHQWSFLQYYTQDSNIIAMIACAAMAVNQALCLCGKRASVPRWATRCKYIAVCMLSVTFLVVIFVLAPSLGSMGGLLDLLTYGPMLYHHTLCPILAYVSFVLFEKDNAIEIQDALIALLPTLAYAMIAIVLNLLRVMEGPYPFLMVYDQTLLASIIWFIVILGGAYCIALLIRRIQNCVIARTV